MNKSGGKTTSGPCSAARQSGRFTPCVFRCWGLFPCWGSDLEFDICRVELRRSLLAPSPIPRPIDRKPASPRPRHPQNASPPQKKMHRKRRPPACVPNSPSYDPARPPATRIREQHSRLSPGGKFISIKRTEVGAGPEVRTHQVVGAEGSPGTRTEDLRAVDIVHVDRDAQHAGQTDEIRADMAVTHDAMVGAPVIHY
jgi:hypothetical protein